MSDFITTNVPLAPSASTTQVVVPDWYTNYARQILSNQAALSGSGYQPYGGPRVAEFGADQQAGFAATRDAATAGQPAVAGAMNAVQGTMGAAPGDAGQGYLAQAGQSTANTVQNFMNPYNDAVAERYGALGARTLQEQLLPAIGDQFVANGNYGSSRQAEAIGKGVRDASESIGAQQAALLQSGYGQAMSAAQSEASRMGGLATTAAGLEQQNLDATRQGATLQATLGNQQQQMALTGAGALTAAGNQQQAQGQKSLDLAYADYLRQEGYDQNTIDSMTKTFQGVATGIPKATLQEGYAPFTGTAPAGTSTTQNIASILAAAGGLFGN